MLVCVLAIHTLDLSADVGKFDAQMEEAKMYFDRNYDIGDLVGDLMSQKSSLQQAYDKFVTKFAQIAVRHLARTEKYIDDLKLKKSVTRPWKTLYLRQTAVGT